MSALMVRKTSNSYGSCEWPGCIRRGQIQVLLLGRNLGNDSHDGQYKVCEPHGREVERIFARKGLAA